MRDIYPQLVVEEIKNRFLKKLIGNGDVFINPSEISIPVSRAVHDIMWLQIVEMSRGEDN